MNKKVMAAAVASALGVAMSGTALAQTSTVQIGGFLNTLYYQHTPNNLNVAKKTDINEQSESNFYITGEEKLGGGLSAWFRCENDIAGASGGTAAALGTCTRNSGLGLRGAFGNFFMGNWDMPQKYVVNGAKGWFSATNTLYGGSSRLLDNGSASGAANPNPTTTGTGGSSAFYRRQSNSLHYHSPSWNGFQVRAGYSAANEAVAIPETSPLKPRMYSLSAEYTAGPLWVGFAYENHADYNPASQLAAAYIGGDDVQWTIGAAYTFANQLRLGARYSDTEYETITAGAGAGQKLDLKGWLITADWTIQGPHSVKALYATTEGGGNSTVSVGSSVTPVITALGTEADIWTLAYQYQFSKRTNVSVAYNKMSNDMGTRYSLGKAAPTMGASQKSIGAALYHRF